MLRQRRNQLERIHGRRGVLHARRLGTRQQAADLARRHRTVPAEGSRIAIQLHYNPDGTDQSDSTRIGLHFAEERTPRNATVLPVINTRFTIPAGAERHEVTAEFSFKDQLRAILPASAADLITSIDLFPLDIVNVFPHMHLLGKSIRMDRISESGEENADGVHRRLGLQLADFYSYVNPVPLGETDRLVVSAFYDNSANNPRNPNSPPVAVSWGERTTDEMCIVFVTLAVPDLCSLPLAFAAATEAPSLSIAGGESGTTRGAARPQLTPDDRMGPSSMPEKLLFEKRGPRSPAQLQPPRTQQRHHTRDAQTLLRPAGGMPRRSRRALRRADGNGKSFSVGADVQSLKSSGQHTIDRIRQQGRPVHYPLSIPKPIVCAINGGCAGVSLVHALCCDVRFAAAGAKMTDGLREAGADRGVRNFVAAAASGRSVTALDLLLSARVVTAEEAGRIGLVKRRLPQGGTAGQGHRVRQRPG